MSYGNVEINTAGTSGYEINYVGVSDPKSLRGKIRSARERFEKEEKIEDRIERIEDKFLTGEITREQFEEAKRRLEERKKRK